jgi:Tfp pilus assembly PilM family ATPase
MTQNHMAEISTQNRLKQFSLPFRRERRSRTPTSVTALDLDGSMLRIAQTTVRSGGPSVTRVVGAPLEFAVDADRTSPEVVGKAIAKALSHLGLGLSQVVMGVPRAQVVLRTLTVPVIKDIEELAAIVHLTISRDLPFRMEEAVIDFRVRKESAPPPASLVGATADSNVRPEPALETTVAPRLEVLVASVKRDVVEFYRQVAEAAGLKLIALGLLPYANARCVEACNVAEGDAPFALVSLRPDEVNIEIIAEQALRFSRGAVIRPAPAAPAGPGADPEVGASAADPARNETLPDQATLEVVRSLHSYGGMEPTQPAAKIVVAGATGLENAVVESLTRRLGRPCTLLDPASALQLRPESQEHAMGAIAAIGLALGLGDTSGLPFDFLNPKRPKVQRDLRRIRILTSIAATAVLAIGLLALRTQLLNRRLKLNTEASAELAEAEKKRPTYRRMILQSGSVEEWIKGGRDWLAHYAYITAILPPSEDVYVSSFTVAGQGNIRLAVQAQSGEILAKLDQKFRAAGYDVKPLPITPAADRFGYEFRSNVELTPTARLKIDLMRAKPPARPSDDASLDPTAYKKGGA